MAKQILFEENARKKLKMGIDKITNAIQVTLGPKARHVVLDKGFGAPEICDDGVTIAKEIELKDRAENLGAEIIKEVAEKPTILPATVLPQPLFWRELLLKKD